MESVDRSILNFLYIAEFSQNKKINTVRSMKKDLTQFNNYLKEKEKIYEPDKITSIMIRGFVVSLQNTKVSKRSINRKISSLRSFFRYVCEINKDIKNPMLDISFFNFYTQDPDILTLDDINKLREAMNGQNVHGIRDRLILELLYSSGITSTEMLGISENMVNIPKRELMVYNGKTGRTVFFSNIAAEYYEKYIQMKKEHFKGKYNPNIVFVNGSGTRLSDRSLRRLIDRYAQKCNFIHEISPYTFRHTFAIYMLTHGMKVNYLKSLMGHVTLESTLFYEDIINRKGSKSEWTR